MTRALAVRRWRTAFPHARTPPGTRCPFSLSRLVKVTKTGQVVYKAEKDACRAFPDPRGNGLAPGPKRNFQILEPLEFLAEFTQHIPPSGSHLIRYYGWYSNKARGMRRRAALSASPLPPGATRAPCAAWSRSVSEGEGCAHAVAPPAAVARSRCSHTWAMLIKRVYEADPLACPHCGGAMKVIAFIEPPQGEVIEKILRHCGLWCPSSPRALPAHDDAVHDPGDDAASQTADEPRGTDLRAKNGTSLILTGSVGRGRIP